MIYKAAGIIIKDRNVLIERSYGKDFYISPGGKIESGEIPEQALIRGLKEECSIEADEADLEFFGDYEA
jgi:8-oxo-dGTP pyrophosphatase MutT (NUDIX family)